MNIQQGENFHILPPAPGKCPVCAENRHGGEMPHNRDSLFYQIQFARVHGRAPTWADAAAECSQEVRAILKNLLVEKGVPDERIGALCDDN